eukprot:m.222407 g.222407  ORF g.222407 m.222407 type:complete len:168 (-) comp54174_c0_seq39:583-1086(-)
MHLGFDFHKECARMRYDRVSLLMNQLESQATDHSYFLVDANRQTHRQQRGVFRTNCLDCLDRTNVVQSMIAQRSLDRQLIDFGVLAVGESVCLYPAVLSLFNNLWADNADALSQQYAGSKALKADFTRTGKRSAYGAMQVPVGCLPAWSDASSAGGCSETSLLELEW